MTDREKAIVMAHTGICMLTGEKFGVFHAYIEDIMGRPVYTHELAIQSISDEIKEKSRDDFIKLCREEQEKTGHWMIDEDSTDRFFATYECSCCKRAIIVPHDAMKAVYKDYPYCHCGAKMQEVEE